ncbi:hypothetical protein KI387_030916, partial [Taxus chinensis]
FAASLAPRFHLNIYKCKHISEAGAQQMLLDTHAVKTILLEVPSIGGQSAASPGYTKFVGREMGKAEALLKVILSPMESVADTYRALLPEGTAADLQRILDLKGLKKGEQQNLLDDFNRHSSGINIPQTAIVPVVLPLPSSPSPTAPSIIGAITNREDVLARAAALGRGAATTSFKRFLALTEAAKDKKDGPFRKLFNT